MARLSAGVWTDLYFVDPCSFLNSCWETGVSEAQRPSDRPKNGNEINHVLSFQIRSSQRSGFVFGGQ